MTGSRLLQRFIRARIARHTARAEVFAAATAAALLAGDHEAAKRFRTDMQLAQAKRDGLHEVAKRICCDHCCDEGRACPART
jgi:hypothetical protein